MDLAGIIKLTGKEQRHRNDMLTGGVKIDFLLEENVNSFTKQIMKLNEDVVFEPPEVSVIKLLKKFNIKP